MEYLRGWEGTIRNHLNAGTFSPFLGAGAASLRSYDHISLDQYPWKEVAETLRQIYTTLPQEPRKFLRNFVRQRLRLSENQAERLVPKGDEIPRKPDDKTNLSDLQVALVNTMRRLTEIFGKLFSDQVPSLRELPDCAVELSFASQDVHDAWLELYKAIEIAKELRRLRTDPAADEDFRAADSPFLPKDVPLESTRRFNVACVYERLVVLARQLITDQNEKTLKSGLFEAQFQKIPDLNRLGENFIGANAARGMLRLDMMQWLGDLLEYSIAYWIPRFPTTAELAFELGLAVPSGPPRRAELAQAAQAFHATDQKGHAATRYIKDLMEYCERAMENDRFAPAHRLFYLAIAVALCDQWDHYDEAQGSPGSARSSETDFYRNFNRDGQATAMQTPAAAADRRRAAFLPVAATTNYDQGLELVLAKYKIPYHVVFPVQGGTDPGAVLQWVCRRVMPDEDADEDKFSSTDVDLPRRVKLKGPVIVKLHGAPTLKAAKDGHGGHLPHKIVVSEQEYLEALRGDAASLKWFEKEMFTRLDDDASQDPDALSRAIWFLGYSIADWNVRLRLYSHLRTKDNNRVKVMRAVNRDYDPFRQAILTQLQINLCHGDLNLVQQEIYSYYCDPTRLAKSSQAVKRLVAAMKAENREK